MVRVFSLGSAIKKGRTCNFDLRLHILGRQEVRIGIIYFIN